MLMIGCVVLLGLSLIRGGDAMKPWRSTSHCGSMSELLDELSTLRRGDSRCINTAKCLATRMARDSEGPCLPGGKFKLWREAYRFSGATMHIYDLDVLARRCCEKNECTVEYWKQWLCRDSACRDICEGVVPRTPPPLPRWRPDPPEPVEVPFHHDAASHAMLLNKSELLFGRLLERPNIFVKGADGFTQR